MASSEQTHQRSVTSRPSKQIFSTANHPVLQPRAKRVCGVSASRTVATRQHWLRKVEFVK